MRKAFAWGYATVRPYFVQHYVRVEYHGAAGTKTVFLLKDSPWFVGTHAGISIGSSHGPNSRQAYS